MYDANLTLPRPLHVALTLALILSGCASEKQATDTSTATTRPTEATSPPGERVTTGRKQASKASAPVADVRLATSGKSGTVEVTLSFEATDDIPRAVARVVLPDGVEHVSGELERDLGAIARGERHTMTITATIPSQGLHLLAGGVDCHLSEGVKLHGGATLSLGSDDADKTPPRVIEDEEVGGVRMGRMR